MQKCPFCHQHVIVHPDKSIPDLCQFDLHFNGQTICNGSGYTVTASEYKVKKS